jgi:hypothetical protein
LWLRNGLEKYKLIREDSIKKIIAQIVLNVVNCIRDSIILPFVVRLLVGEARDKINLNVHIMVCT